MFIPKCIVEKLTSVYDGVLATSRRDTEMSLERVLSAKDAETRAVVAAKDSQIAFLTGQLDAAQKLIERERARAEAATDTLLNLKLDVPGIRMADLQREAASREASGAAVPAPKESAGAQREQELKRVFRELNSVGEDLEDARDEAGGLAKGEVATIGGVPVAVGV